MTFRRFLAVSLALLIVLLAACNSQEPDTITVSATPPPPLITPSDIIGPDNFPPGVNPLTGERVDNPAVLDRRPLAIKISNAPDTVRPQAGIGAADLVFEHYVEADLTRFTAIYWTNTPYRVGSVRSARLIDLEIPAMYGTLFAYSGASDPIRQRIAGLPFANRAYEGVSVGEPAYYRDTGIEAPHNLFVTPAEIWAKADQDGVDDPPKLSGMAFSPTPPHTGIKANTITINYGPDVVEWRYDPATDRYLRFEDGKAHLDANTGEQVTAANVILIYAHHQEDLSIVESEWQGVKSFSIEIQIWTLGPTTLFRDGEMLQGYWMRWNENDMLTFWADQGQTQRLYLKPGNTWFQVVPLDFAGLSIG